MSRRAHPIAEIFSQGDEVVTGEIADTNAAWLAGELTRQGFEVGRHSTVGDRLDALVGLLREIAGRADLCLCTGGLGPTCDDLTAEAVALAFDRPLALDAEALGQIEAWFRRMDRDMPAVNRKQALLPRGARRLDNAWGTAPGFAVGTTRCHFFFMPGVPREMMAMFRERIRPRLPDLFHLEPQRRVVLRTVGLGESTLQERLDGLALPAEMQLGFRAGGAENQVKLAFPADFDAARREATVQSVADAIGAPCYAVVRDGEGPAGLVDAVGVLLRARGGRLSILDSVSAGLLASRCGDADWLAHAHVEPATPRLPARFGVEPAAGPEATALRLARALLRQAGDEADHALVQWTECPPAELRADATRAELFTAVAGPGGASVESRPLTGAWPRKRDTAAVFGLDVLRRRLADPPA